jgi:hypothetical protein
MSNAARAWTLPDANLARAHCHCHGAGSSLISEVGRVLFRRPMLCALSDGQRRDDSRLMQVDRQEALLYRIDPPATVAV